MSVALAAFTSQVDGYKIVIRSPRECTQDQINEFIALLTEGNEVDTRGVEARIRRAASLGFAYDNETLIGIAAVKVPADTYRRAIERKSGVELDSEEYPFEAGWLYVKPQYRDQKIGQSLRGLTILAALRLHEGIFSTTRDNNTIAKHILEKFGFTQEGSTWTSERSGTPLALFTKNPGIDDKIARGSTQRYDVVMMSPALVQAATALALDKITSAESETPALGSVIATARSIGYVDAADSLHHALLLRDTGNAAKALNYIGTEARMDLMKSELPEGSEGEHEKKEITVEAAPDASDAIHRIGLLFQLSTGLPDARKELADSDIMGHEANKSACLEHLGDLGCREVDQLEKLADSGADLIKAREVLTRLDRSIRNDMAHAEPVEVDRLQRVLLNLETLMADLYGVNIVTASTVVPYAAILKKEGQLKLVEIVAVPGRVGATQIIAHFNDDSTLVALAETPRSLAFNLNMLHSGTPVKYKGEFGQITDHGIHLRSGREIKFKIYEYDREQEVGASASSFRTVSSDSSNVATAGNQVDFYELCKRLNKYLADTKANVVLAFEKRIGTYYYIPFVGTSVESGQEMPVEDMYKLCHKLNDVLDSSIRKASVRLNVVDRPLTHFKNKWALHPYAADGAMTPYIKSDATSETVASSDTAVDEFMQTLSHVATASGYDGSVKVSELRNKLLQGDSLTMSVLRMRKNYIDSYFGGDAAKFDNESEEAAYLTRCGVDEIIPPTISRIHKLYDIPSILKTVQEHRTVRKFTPSFSYALLENERAYNFVVAYRDLYANCVNLWANILTDMLPLADVFAKVGKVHEYAERMKATTATTMETTATVTEITNDDSLSAESMAELVVEYSGGRARHGLHTSDVVIGGPSADSRTTFKFKDDNTVQRYGFVGYGVANKGTTIGPIPFTLESARQFAAALGYSSDSLVSKMRSLYPNYVPSFTNGKHVSAVSIADSCKAKMEATVKAAPADSKLKFFHKAATKFWGKGNRAEVEFEFARGAELPQLELRFAVDGTVSVHAHSMDWAKDMAERVARNDRVIGKFAYDTETASALVAGVANLYEAHGTGYTVTKAEVDTLRDFVVNQIGKSSTTPVATASAASDRLYEKIAAKVSSSNPNLRANSATVTDMMGTIIINIQDVVVPVPAVDSVSRLLGRPVDPKMRSFVRNTGVEVDIEALPKRNGKIGDVSIKFEKGSERQRIDALAVLQRLLMISDSYGKAPAALEATAGAMTKEQGRAALRDAFSKLLGRAKQLERAANQLAQYDVDADFSIPGGTLYTIRAMAAQYARLDTLIHYQLESDKAVIEIAFKSLDTNDARALAQEFKPLLRGPKVVEFRKLIMCLAGDLGSSYKREVGDVVKLSQILPGIVSDLERGLQSVPA